MPALVTAGGSADPGLTSAGGNDGALTLQTGPAGAKVDAIALAADGTPTFAKPPKTTGTVSMVFVNTAAGNGSTNTNVRRFTNGTNGANGCIIQGTDITYTSSAANGDSFTVNTSGTYSISYFDGSSGGSATYGISLNSVSATPPAGSQLSMASASAANLLAAMNWTGPLAAGSVIRAINNGAGVNPSNGTPSFTITRIG